MGSRLLDTFAEGLEENSITVKRLTEDLTLSKRNLGRSFLHEVILDDEDHLEPVETSNGYEWVYPTVTGISGILEYPVEKVDTLTDLLMAMPSRLTLDESVSSGSRVVWISTSPFTYNLIPYPERLWIHIENSTFYVNKTIRTDRDKSGLAAIIIEGTDYDYNVFKEIVNVSDDGIFVTANSFRSVTSVIPEGFNGIVTITAGPVDEPHELDPFRVMVLDDLEGPLKIELTKASESFITYKADRFKLGRQYRRPGVEVLENAEDLADLLLLDTDGNTYEAVDLAVSPSNTYLYVLDTLGKVYVYDHSLPEFIAPSTNDTTTSYVQLEAVRPYAKYGNTEYLWTRFERLRFPVSWIKIKRVAPDATVEYLQSDKTTWGTSETKISYPTIGKNTLDQWKDFRFQTEYNQTGLWEYVLTVKTQVDQTVFVTVVSCGSLRATVTLDTGVSNPELLYFGDSGQLIVDTGSTAYIFNEHVDKYVIEERSSHIYLSDNYDSVRVE
jgi:hypothetical protein